MIKAIKSAEIVRCTAGVLAAVLLVSCAGLNKEDDKGNEPEKDKDVRQ